MNPEIRENQKRSKKLYREPYKAEPYAMEDAGQSQGEDSNNNQNEDTKFELELYKSLRREVVLYLEKVPSLWLQKFVLVGAVIAFLITKLISLPQVPQTATLLANSTLLAIAVLAIPILAALLDAKILEYSLHARVISRFIASNFTTPPVLGGWEAYLWGDQGTREAVALVRLRSLTTVVVTVAPTIVLIILSCMFTGELLHKQKLWTLLAGGVSLFYLAMTWYVWRRIWPAVSPKSQPNEIAKDHSKSIHRRLAQQGPPLIHWI